MIWFYRFEIRLQPHETALELFAPSWEDAAETEDYRKLLAERQPRSLCVIEHPYWYVGSKEERRATAGEIAEWTKNGAYLHMTQIKAPEPLYTYRYFGNESVLAALEKKLWEDYEAKLSQWRSSYEHNGTISMEQLREMCVTGTVYFNLLQCGCSYPWEYMAALAAEAHPLRTLSEWYDQSPQFDIEPDARDLLGILSRHPKDLGNGTELDPRAEVQAGHTERMALLDAHLDKELAMYIRKWDGLSFDDYCKSAMEIYTIRQLYHTLRFEKEKYPAGQLACMARLKSPMAYDRDRLVGERNLYVVSSDVINGIFPQMYPDITPEPDAWASPEKPENGENVLSQGFNLQ